MIRAAIGRMTENLTLMLIWTFQESTAETLNDDQGQDKGQEVGGNVLN